MAAAHGLKRPYCVALTGGAGSGKSTVAARLATLGACVVDTDGLARDLVAPGMPALAEIVAVFGADILQTDGCLDRARLRTRIFSNASARLQLEAILHPRIRTLAAERLAACRSPYALLVVPLLTEHGDAYRALIDRVLVVDCSEAVQQARLMARDGLTADAAQAMLAAQAGRMQRLATADDVFDNSTDNTDAVAWCTRVDALHADYLQCAENRRVAIY